MPAAPRQFLSIDVGPLRERIEARAVADGTRAGPWVKQVIEGALAANEPPKPRPLGGAAAHPAPNRQHRQGAHVKVTVRLTEAESAALSAGAAAAGLSCAEYVARFAVGDTPRLAASQPALIAALTDSNHQLVALGRNLNQIAKSLNAYPGRMSPADHRFILATAEATRAHLDLVARHLAEMTATRRTKARRDPAEA